MTTFLVTGGAGFIGSHVCDLLLAQGHRVVAVDDLSTGRLANIGEARASGGSSFTFYKMDIRAEGLRGVHERHRPDVVAHLAAAGAASSAVDPVAEARVGLMGLLAVLEAAAGSGVSKVVHASSAAMYGDAKRVPLKESALAGARLVSPAAISKRGAEDYLRFYRRARNLDFTSIVLPSVYGPRQDPHEASGVVAAFAGSMLAGRPPVIHGDGLQTRDFLFVDDAVHALSLAVGEGSGRTLNVGTGEETGVLKLFGMLAAITGFQGDPARDEARVGDVRRSALDTSLAQKHLGWKPWTHLEDGLRETVAFLRDG